MLKLMKYEFKKQAFSKYVILALVALIELVFFFGVITDKENIIAVSLGILWMFTFGALFYIAFESIITFSNDLKQKSSYMLFLTPRTPYSIVGAKVVAAGLQVVLAGIAFFLLFALDGSILLAKYNKLSEIKELVVSFVNQFLQLDLDVYLFITIAVVLISSWIATITTAFFSITLSTTFLANSKLRGVVSFGIFIILNIIIYYISNKTMSSMVFDNGNLNDLTKVNVISSIYNLVFIILTYFGTAWMLDKKVSV